MNKLLLFMGVVGLLGAGCQAGDAGVTAGSSAVESPRPAQPAASGQSLREEIYNRAKSRKDGAEPTKLDLFNELMHQGAEQAGAVKDYGKPRVIARGAKPEIFIKDNIIVVNGTQLRLTDSIDMWRRVLPQNPRCDNHPVRTMCIWDNLGLSLLTQSRENLSILQMQVFFNFESSNAFIPAEADEGIPKHAFSGYLMLDGYGIDAKTKFWEIRASVDPKRNLRCNSRDCSHPHGGFGDTEKLYMRLNSSSEYGNLYELTISSNESNQ